MKNKALFLDRDGTIIEHVPYINDPSKVKLRKDILEKLKEFQKAGYLLIIITNQSGIERGLITIEQYQNVTNKMLSLLSLEGITITDIFMCPSHPSKNDYRRKPNPGMILEAAKKYNIDLKNSILVGDDAKDIQAGKNAGVGHCLYLEEFLSFSV
ncbi:MAG: HAD family hydrolase [Candidatus Micrarchaeota archaeon]|nr:HAD family hydrolase [Candidatus Micrarchaeota archaeon]